MIPYLMHHHLERWADETPDRPAVEFDGEVTSYGELDHRANQIAGVLMGLDVEPGDRVGLWLERSTDAVAAYFGVLKTGAICNPFDDRAPIVRLSTIASDCDVGVVVTRPDRASAAAGLGSNGVGSPALMVLGGDAPAVAGVAIAGDADVAAHRGGRPDRRRTELDPAVILYTSGSTGTPKGVVLSHRSAGSLSDLVAGWFRLGPGDRAAQLSSLHYVASLGDLFGVLTVGGTAVLAPADIAVLPTELPRFLKDRRITFFGGVASMLIVLVERGGLCGADLPGLRGIFFGGEPMAAKHVRRLTEAFPGVALVQGYGTTEAAASLMIQVPDPVPSDFERLSAGWSGPNMEAFLVTDAGHRAGPGESGEILARGRSVMSGYWGRPDETRAALVSHPFDPDCPDLAFRTGDIGLVAEDGSITVVGRRDHQVNTRGVRVELAEVEAAVAGHPAVVECAVVAVDDDVFTTLLVGHVVTRAEVTPRQLATWCRSRLAPAMVPASFEIHEGLPKTSSGKIDRAGLRSRPSDTT